MDFSAVKANLEQLGYAVSCFETAAQAADYLACQVNGKTVGFGGSATLEQMGLYEKLASHNDVFWHHHLRDGKTAPELRNMANAAQIYFSSVNGLAETGEIINIDGACNRVSSILYGHEKVYLVAGSNKLARDYDSALFRARNVAAPMNAKRLGAKTPCAAKGDRCYNCKSEGRICRALSVLWGPPMRADFEVVLINEALGF